MNRQDARLEKRVKKREAELYLLSNASCDDKCGPSKEKDLYEGKKINFVGSHKTHSYSVRYYSIHKMVKNIECIR